MVLGRATLFLTALVAALAAPAADAKRPNILVFFPDELRHDWVNNGTDTDFLNTPNIDSIRERAIKFDRTISASPICGPSRACFAAASHYEEVGVLTNYFNFPINRLTTFYKLLRDSGYHTMAVGKLDLAKNETLHSYGWGHNGSEHAEEWGFSRMVNSVGVYESSALENPDANGSYIEPYTDYLLQFNRTDDFLQDIRDRITNGHDGTERVYTDTYPNPLPDELFNDNWVADKAVELLAEKPEDKEWFMIVNWNGPHYPMSVTERMWTSVQGRQFPAPVDYDYETGNMTLEHHNRTRGDYAALIENIDSQIGRILNSVNLSDTIVVFSSDHGEMLGDKSHWSKSVPYQASVGVPLLIAGDAVVNETLRNTSTNVGVSLIDLARTFLDIGEVEDIPNQMSDAISLRPVLEGTGELPRRVVRSAYSTWHLWFDGRFKYVTGYNDVATLYDLDNDPFERENLLEETNTTLLQQYGKVVQWLLGKGEYVEIERNVTA